MNFSQKLVTLRKQCGLSQEQLGLELNVSRQTISKWELGDTTPELDKLVLIGDFFDVSLDELVKGLNSSNHTNEDKNKLKYYGLIKITMKVLLIFLIIDILSFVIYIIFNGLPG